MACDDLRIGGALTGAGLSGGISVNGSGITVADWSGLFGHVGYNLAMAQVAGRPGATLVGDALPKVRFLNLNLKMYQEQRTGGSVMATPGAYLRSNQDTILGYLTNPTGFYLEVDDPISATRFVFCNAPDPASIDALLNTRVQVIPLIASEPYWKVGGAETSVTSGAGGTITNSGNAAVYDAILTFSGAGTYTNTTAGWTLITSGACVIDCGNRTIQVGGVNSDNLLTTRTDQAWAWFLPGANSVTRTVSITTTYRSQWG